MQSCTTVPVRSRGKTPSCEWTAVTICGTDLHILKGDVPAVTDGRIIGHEVVGTVESVGSGVKNVKVGDRILVSCITACGACRYCREGSYGQCLGDGGWILGHKIDGTQADYVRVPFADTSTHPVPAGATDEQILMLADILPTGFEVGVLNGKVRPGDVVAIVGAGPIGLSAMMGSRLYSPSQESRTVRRASRATHWQRDTSACPPGGRTQRHVDMRSRQRGGSP